MRVGRFVVGLLALVGGVVTLLLIAVVVIGLFFSMRTAHRVPAKTIVEVNFEKGLAEYAPDGSIPGVLSQDRASIRGTIDAIERAGEDDRVVALIGRVGVTGMRMATIQEMRNAILGFRGKGKPAIAFAETFGEFGPGNGAYYLATAFDQIYMQPSGDVGLTGLRSSAPFLRGTLDKLGITPRLDHRGKYKTAMNMFTERSFTDAHRESTMQIMESQFSQITSGIAGARGITQDAVMTLVNRGPFSANDAVNAHLLDGLGYRDEVDDMLKERVGKDTEVLSLSKYGRATGEEDGNGQTIALIYGLGTVHRGESEFSLLDGGLSMGSETLVKAFRDASRDDSVRAILFRVNSPGGSYVASDTIWREILRVRESKKPVIVSMGDVAASGGYFVAMAADKIVAQPATLTGSIGVLAGKAVTRDFWNKLGVTWDGVETSAHASMWTSLKDYTPEEWALFQRWIDRVYEDFVGKVADSRRLPREKVAQIAQGRVWTGETAKELGLVDELGGIPEAIQLAKNAAGIPGDAKVQFKVFPRPKSIAERIRESLLGGGAESGMETGLVSVDKMVKAVQPIVGLAREMGLLSGPGVLVMPPIDSIE